MKEIHNSIGAFELLELSHLKFHGSDSQEAATRSVLSWGWLCFSAENPENNATRQRVGILSLIKHNALVEFDNKRGRFAIKKNKNFNFQHFLSRFLISAPRRAIFLFFLPAEMTNVGGRCYPLWLRAKSNLPRGPWLQVETCWRVGSCLSGTSSRRCFLPLRMYQIWFFA